ncbi:hypothetical protein CDL15_Pgr005504 [Punica granatum]|uniref:Malectin-like domain-containing protein n=1 Tax=Punica granatum TaxID=22663 RepID=A0A218WW02_PUNGR|nr:hypothetical protein CDL15_Pgr005504 [Punica granatum]
MEKKMMEERRMMEERMEMERKKMEEKMEEDRRKMDMLLAFVEEMNRKGNASVGKLIGFISIDCGASKPSTDPVLQLYYQTDDGFIDSGENRQVTGDFTNGEVIRPTAETLRAFPIGTRNCYTIRPITETDEDSRKYLIRASFLYGNYDNQNRTPTFDLHIGVTFWVTVRLPNLYTHVHKEVIHVVPPTSDAIQVCLVNTGNGTPLISSLELRQLSNATYLTDVHFPTLALHKRLNIGSTKYLLYRHPCDVYDRIWSRDDKNYGADKVFLSWNGSSDPSLNRTNDPYKVPTGVLDTWAAGLESTFKFEQNWGANMAAPSKWIVYFHFAELMNKTSQRKFTIYSNNKVVETIDLNYLEPVTVCTHQFTSDTGLQFQFVTSGSSSPPILNALELYRLLDISTAPTNIDDVTAMNVIKKTYSVRKESWQGDPCVPTNFTWDGVNCSTESPPRIISFDLSGNDLSGSVPKNLRTKADDGTLDLRLDGNPKLCKSSSCGLSKKTKYIIIGTVLLVAVGSASAVWSWTTHWKKENAQISQGVESQGQEFQDVESNKTTSKPEGQGTPTKSTGEYEENNKEEDRSSLKEGDEQYKKLSQEVSSLKKMLTKQVTMWSQVPRFMGQMKTIIGGMSGQPADAVFPQQHDSQHCRLDKRQQRDGDDENEKDSGQNDAQTSNELGRELTPVKEYEKSHKRKQDGSGVNPHATKTTEAYRQARSQEDNYLATQESVAQKQGKATGRKKKGLIHWMNWLRRHGFISALAGSSETAHLSEEQYKQLSLSSLKEKLTEYVTMWPQVEQLMDEITVSMEALSEQSADTVFPQQLQSQQQRPGQREQKGGDDEDGEDHGQDDAQMAVSMTTMSGQPTAAVFPQQHYSRQRRPIQHRLRGGDNEAEEYHGQDDAQMVVLSFFSLSATEQAEGFRDNNPATQEDNSPATQELVSRTWAKALGRNKKGIIHWMNCLCRLGSVSGLVDPSGMAPQQHHSRQRRPIQHRPSGGDNEAEEYRGQDYSQMVVLSFFFLSATKQSKELGSEPTPVEVYGKNYKKKEDGSGVNPHATEMTASSNAMSQEDNGPATQEFVSRTLVNAVERNMKGILRWMNCLCRLDSISGLVDPSGMAQLSNQYYEQLTQGVSSLKKMLTEHENKWANVPQLMAQMTTSTTAISGQPHNAAILKQHRSWQHRTDQRQWRGGDDEGEENHGHDDTQMDASMAAMPGLPADVVSPHPHHSRQQRLNQRQKRGGNYEDAEDHGQDNAQMSRELEEEPTVVEMHDINDKRKDDAEIIETDQQTRSQEDNSPATQQSKAQMWANPAGRNKKGRLQWMNWLCRQSSINALAGPFGTAQMSDEQFDQLNQEVSSFEKMLTEQVNVWSQVPEFMAQMTASIRTMSSRPANDVSLQQHHTRQRRPNQRQQKDRNDEGEEDHEQDDAQTATSKAAMSGGLADVVFLQQHHSQQCHLNQHQQKGGDDEDEEGQGLDNYEMAASIGAMSGQPAGVVFPQQHRSQQCHPNQRQQRGRDDEVEEDRGLDDAHIATSMVAMLGQPTDAVFLQQYHSQQRRPNQRQQRGEVAEDKEDRGQGAEMAASIADMFGRPADVFSQLHHSQQCRPNQPLQRGGNVGDVKDHGQDAAQTATSMAVMSSQLADAVFPQQRHPNQRQQRGGDEEKEEGHGQDDTQMAVSITDMLGRPTDVDFLQQHHSQQRHPNQRQQRGEVAEDKEDRGEDDADMAASIANMLGRPADVVFSQLHQSQQHRPNQRQQRVGNVEDAKNHGQDHAQMAASMAAMSGELADAVFLQQHHSQQRRPNQRQQRGGDDEEEEYHGQDHAQMAVSMAAMFGQPTNVVFPQQHHSQQRHPNQRQQRSGDEHEEDRGQDDAQMAASTEAMLGQAADVVFPQQHHSQQRYPNQRQQRGGDDEFEEDRGLDDAQIAASMVAMLGQPTDVVFSQLHNSQQCRPNQRRQRGEYDRDAEDHGQDNAQMVASMAAMLGGSADVVFLQQHYFQQRHSNQRQQRGEVAEDKEDCGQDDADMAASIADMLGRPADVVFSQLHHSQQRRPDQRQQRGENVGEAKDHGQDDAQAATSMVTMSGRLADVVFSQQYHSQQRRLNQRQQGSGDDEDEQDRGKDVSRTTASMVAMSGRTADDVFLQQQHSQTHRSDQSQQRGGENEDEEDHGQDDVKWSKDG